MGKKTKQYAEDIGCIGSIEKARGYARDSLVYGLKTKSDYTKDMSPRSYDSFASNMDHWFDSCLQTRRVAVRKKVRYLSLDCRDYSANPIYKIWKTCSFTTNEIVFFFSLLNFFSKYSEPASIEEVYTYYDNVHGTDGFTKHGAQKWMQNKGCKSGIIVKVGRKYKLADSVDLSKCNDMLLFYSEIAPGGVVGSFIIDKLIQGDSPFRFKQRFPGQAFDHGIIINILYAIKNHRTITFQYPSKDKKLSYRSFLPVKVYSSAQNGRQYVVVWNEYKQFFSNYRIDKMRSISVSDEPVCEAASIKQKYEDVKSHVWGISFGNGELTHVEFLIKVSEDEYYVVNRLLREKHCGRVSHLENHPGIFKFEADVYDANEMIPWIRTFISRIVSLSVSDSDVEKVFWDSLEDMYNMYLSGDFQ